jgi:hypothetical protein
MLALITVHAAGGASQEWSTDTFVDFAQGTMNGVDIWNAPGSALLDHRWSPNVKVNRTSLQDKIDPRLTFALTSTGTTTSTVFLAVWADERVEDHDPDIFFSRSADSGHNWSPDTMVSGAHMSGHGKYSPDITVRRTDGSLWVVWQDDRSDGGDIYYSVSHDQGASWDTAAAVYSGSGTQRFPRIAPHGASGYLYTVWQDERADTGDIYISRFTGSAWSTPLKISDDSSGKEQRDPNLTVDVNGNVYAVWTDTRNDPEGEVYFTRWISGTTWDAGNWSTNTRLSDPTMDYAEDPDILAGPGSVLFAAWMERVPTGPATYDFQIVVARSTDGGNTWSRSVVDRLTNASASNAFYANPSLGLDHQGRAYVAWLHSPDSQAGTSDILFSLSPDGGVHWTEPRPINWPGHQVDVDTIPAIASDFEGQVVVAWQDFREGSATQIYAAGYPANQFLPSGEYHRTLDVGGLAAWGNITWTATISPGTGLQVAARVMTSTGAGWTEWFTPTVSGEAIPHPAARFIQYRAVLTSTGTDTPRLDEVRISYQPYQQTFLPLVVRRN